MEFPLTVWDVSLWLAVMAIILLITSELLFSSTSFAQSIVVDKKRLRLVALGLGASFMVTVVMRAFQPM